MGRVKLKRAKVDEPMAEIAGGKRDKPALQTQQHAAPREASSVVPCRAVPCAVCAVRLLLRGVTPSRAADVELRRLAVFSTPAWDTTTKRRRAASQAAAPQAATPGAAGRGQQRSSAAAFASFEDSLQKPRHRACVKRHAASCFAA